MPLCVNGPAMARWSHFGFLFSNSFYTLAQCTPATGVESFENNLGQIASAPGALYGIAECYGFTIAGGFGTSTISSNGETIELSNPFGIGYFDIDSSDISAFNLENFVFSRQDASYDGDMIIYGLKDGSLVNGAEETVTINGTPSQTVDLSSNSGFQSGHWRLGCKKYCQCSGDVL